MAKLPRLTARQIEDIARRLRITDFETGTSFPWRPSQEQVAAWEFSAKHRRKFIAKPRRVFISTAFDLEDALWTATCDAARHRVRCAVVLDTDDKVRERTWQMGSFLAQLGIPHDRSDHRIAFPGESEIVGLTAGGKRAGASTGFQRIRYSEFSYYSGDTASIMATAGADAEEVIETTVDITAANGEGARHYWRSPVVGFARLFFPFEMHAIYRGDPEAITDDEWRWAQDEGFSMRAAAAYWLREIVPNKCGGDVAKAMHEYPQRPEHMFQASSSRTIAVTPEVRQPTHEIRVPGASSEWVVDVYRQPENTSGHVVIGVDTSLARQRSRSAVVVVDKADLAICACLASDVIREDDLARVALAAQAAYEGWDRLRARPIPAFIVCESNGIGQATCHQLDRLGASYDSLEQDEASKDQCVLEAKRAIESGQCSGPVELAEECDELHRDPKTGRYVGRKDVIMALGMALRARREDTPAAEPYKDGVDRFRIDDIVREGKIMQGLGARPPWGW